MDTLAHFTESPIQLLARRVAISPLIAQLQRHPELWNENTFRTEGGYGNPHAQLSDIVLRYRDWSEWTGDRRSFVDPPHDAVWWGSAEKLMYVREMVADLARMLFADRIGMVLLTRIPPHTRCEPHVDSGWHATYYEKFAVQIKANDQQRFCFEGAELVTAPGDLFTFDNSKLHWVENDSDEERITLIICLHMPRHTCREYRYSGKVA